jgi:hypothetical protein
MQGYERFPKEPVDINRLPVRPCTETCSAENQMLPEDFMRTILADAPPLP